LKLYLPLEEKDIFLFRKGLDFVYYTKKQNQGMKVETHNFLPCSKPLLKNVFTHYV